MKTLNDKINTGMKLASRNNDDIIFWAGSNDYILSDFFEQVINYLIFFDLCTCALSNK